MNSSDILKTIGLKSKFKGVNQQKKQFEEIYASMNIYYIVKENFKNARDQEFIAFDDTKKYLTEKCKIEISTSKIREIYKYFQKFNI